MWAAAMAELTDIPKAAKMADRLGKKSVDQ